MTKELTIEQLDQAKNYFWKDAITRLSGVVCISFTYFIAKVLKPLPDNITKITDTEIIGYGLIITFMIIWIYRCTETIMMGYQKKEGDK